MFHLVEGLFGKKGTTCHSTYKIVICAVKASSIIAKWIILFP